MLLILQNQFLPPKKCPNILKDLDSIINNNLTQITIIWMRLDKVCVFNQLFMAALQRLADEDISSNSEWKMFNM